MSQMNPKEVFHNALHTQFNYLTQPVTLMKMGNSVQVNLIKTASHALEKALEKTQNANFNCLCAREFLTKMFKKGRKNIYIFFFNLLRI